MARTCERCEPMKRRQEAVLSKVSGIKEPRLAIAIVDAVRKSGAIGMTVCSRPYRKGRKTATAA